MQRTIGTKKYPGGFKSIVPTRSHATVDGVTHIRYGYEYSGERFERPDITYRFSVKKSTQQGGVVRQLQLELGCIGWGAVDSPSDAYGELLGKKKLDFIKASLHPDEDEFEPFIREVDARIKACIQALKDEYHQSEEYAVTRQNRRRINQWLKAKDEFDRQYGPGYFEEIYDFNLTVMNADLLARLRRENGQEDASSSGGGQQQHSAGDTAYSEAEKETLKKFYKTLAKNYHPDVSGDDGKAMQLLNKLKEQWKL